MTQPDGSESRSAATPGTPPPADATHAPPHDVDLLLGDYAGVDESAESRRAERQGGALTGAGLSGGAAAPGGVPDTARSATAPRSVGARDAAPSATALAYRTVASALWGEEGTGEQGSRIWLLWWIVVVLVPLLGGVAAWFALRRTHQRVSRTMLGVGIAVGMLGSLLFLRYAADIAGYVTGATRNTVIPPP